MSNLSLEFIAGLVDSDGCLELQIGKEQGNTLKHKGIIIFSITNKDYKLLRDVKETLACGDIFCDKNNFVYRLRNRSSIIMIQDKLGPLFRASARKEMPLWKRGLVLLQNKLFVVRGKKDLSSESYENIREYIYLMYAMNSKGNQRKKSLDEWLEIFKLKPITNFHEISTKLKKDFELITPLKPLNVDYVSGFCHGDGSFNLSNKKRFRPCFSIIDKDNDIIEHICDFLELPRSTIFQVDPKTRPKNQICYRLQLDSFEGCCKKILPVFDNALMLHHCKERYTLWRKAIILQQYGKTYRKQMDYIYNKLKSLRL